MLPDDTVSSRVRPSPGLSVRREANVILIAHPEQKMLGVRFVLAPGSHLEIGRSPGADLCLLDLPSVSRRHARLEHHGDSITLEDLGSTNGTFINDRRFSTPMTLRSGDRFQVGPVHFKFLYDVDIEHSYHSAISDLVFRDGLTRAYNRRRFEEETERECARSSRYGRPLSLILLDLDGFKAINDRHGHAVGDAVLRRIAALVEEELRSEQLFARIGGDEFAILCPESGSECARKIAGRLSDRIRGLDSFDSGGVTVALSASFGVAELAGPVFGPETLLVAADHALYESKAAATGKVTVFVDRSGDRPTVPGFRSAPGT